jgi:hypothetical protein
MPGVSKKREREMLELFERRYQALRERREAQQQKQQQQQQVIADDGSNQETEC